jgi:leucyl aminopeptidase
MWNEYVELTKSNIADLRNYSNESRAGTIMAGAFLSHFVPNDTKWIHLDIAGVDNLENGSVTRHYGATGEILRSLFYFLQNYHKENYEK